MFYYNSENRQWIEELSVGDNVAYVRDWFGSNYRYSKVAKMSNKIRVITLEDGTEFNPDGYERTSNSSKYFKKYLVKPELAAKHIESEKKETLRISLKNEVGEILDKKLKHMTLEQLQQLKQTLDDMTKQ